jgi:predicted transcriptional regulator
MSNWTIFSNHGHVLFCLARDSESRLRDVATDVGITERAVQKIVRDLQACGMISVSKHGRRNRYRIDNGKSLRHDLEAHCTLGVLIDLIGTKPVTMADSATFVSPEPEPVSIVESVEIPPIESPVSKKPGKAVKSDSKPVVERQQGSLF